jgi:hypothetical protein
MGLSVCPTAQRRRLVVLLVTASTIGFVLDCLIFALHGSGELIVLDDFVASSMIDSGCTAAHVRRWWVVVNCVVGVFSMGRVVALRSVVGFLAVSGLAAAVMVGER